MLLLGKKVVQKRQKDSFEPLWRAQEEKIQEYVSKGLSVGDLVRMGIVTVKKNEGSPFKISLQYENIMETSIIELFRADFNNDGIEDIFTRGWCRAVGGSFGAGFTKILTRYSPTHLIEPIK